LRPRSAQQPSPYLPDLIHVDIVPPEAGSKEERVDGGIDSGGGEGEGERKVGGRAFAVRV
jgi:hypothetical protein